MAKRIPKPFIDELTARTDLLALLSSRVTFTKKSGSNHWACCPFHDEKTPSFSVNTQKGFYHCFGCGVSGDAIRFLMDYDNLPFPEAVERLAEYNGLDVPYEDDGRQSDPQEKDRYDLGLECLADAAAYFHEAFYSDSGKAARDYLRQRNLKKATVDTFQLGYAPPGNALLAHLGSKYPLQLLQDVGLVGVKDDHHYDWFRERVIFPIHNHKGKVIAFGARAMGEAQPKYLNSPETTWFNKRYELYGLHQAMQTRERTLLVTEGYMDVIKLWQHGIKNAVAALGTAIGETHISQLKKRAEKIYFSFDGDTAGQKRHAKHWKRFSASTTNSTNGASCSCLPAKTPTRSSKKRALPPSSRRWTPACPPPPTSCKRWTTARAHNAAPKHKPNWRVKHSAGWSCCPMPISAKSCARK